jgi:hypothetical protein
MLERNAAGFRSTLIWLSLAFIFLTAPIAAAQTSSNGSESPIAATSPNVTVSLDERLQLMEQELRRQGKLLEQMRETIAEQQRFIAQLSNKPVSSEGLGAASSQPAAKTDGTVPVTTSEAQSTPLENRVKQLEDQVTKIGPFRFSGDFRLRFDGIFHSADPNPPAGITPLTHVQNARARYRLRLNFETDINSKISFHGQLATGPVNNEVTTDQDFSAITARHPFFLNEAWIDYHPNRATDLQGGRVLEIFADNSRFLFDDDIRFNGFNEKYVVAFAHNAFKVSDLEIRAGQYIFSNPNVAIVTAGSPLALAGAEVGSTGRAANLFHQGLLLNQKFNEHWSSQFGGDVQIYRNPNQIQLSSTNGIALIVQNGLGITLSGPLTGTGNATTTPGGAIYTARNFDIARLTYRLGWSGFKSVSRAYPVLFNIQFARNVGIGMPERDAFLGSIQIGRVEKRGDMAFLYLYSQKGANAIISQLTDDDLGTNSGVNIRTHHFKFEYGLAKKITLQSLLYIQNELRSSGDFPNFFVPMNAFTPRQYRLQEQIVFHF